MILLVKQMLRFDAYNLISDLLFLRYTYPTRIGCCFGGELLLLVGILIIVAVWTDDYRKEKTRL